MKKRLGTAAYSVVILLAVVCLSGCQEVRQDSQGRFEAETETTLLEAVLAQRAFYEAGGEELRAQYEKVAEKYPLIRQYITLHEVAFSLYAMSDVVPEHDIDCMEYRMLTSPGNTVWFSFCRDDIFTPDFECIRVCLDCLKTARSLSCLQDCGCLKRIEETDQ